MPCQDTPAAKCTYSARLVVPSPLTALMSALSTRHEPVGDAKQVAFYFEQKVPIPSYLLALAVGCLEKRDISPRCAVWSEKEAADKARFEFEDTERFLAIAEEICGPYAWGRYDILLMPPSFPYGGMENPCLTFVTPTLLAGDKSLANVVAHEIAHSWMGNLVGCETWEHFWMNEGNIYLLLRVLIAVVPRFHCLFGTQDLQSSSWQVCFTSLFCASPRPYRFSAAMHLEAITGWNSLIGSVNAYGCCHKFTELHVNLKGCDPDDAFSSIPYEKGFNFLFYLESIVGEAAMNGIGVFHDRSWCS
jgi:leukotriene-A4 hydrolase